MVAILFLDHCLEDLLVLSRRALSHKWRFFLSSRKTVLWSDFCSFFRPQVAFLSFFPKNDFLVRFLYCLSVFKSSSYFMSDLFGNCTASSQAIQFDRISLSLSVTYRWFFDWRHSFHFVHVSSSDHLAARVAEQERPSLSRLLNSLALSSWIASVRGPLYSLLVQIGYLSSGSMSDLWGLFFCTFLDGSLLLHYFFLPPLLKPYLMIFLLIVGAGLEPLHRKVLMERNPAPTSMRG